MQKKNQTRCPCLTQLPKASGTHNAKDQAKDQMPSLYRTRSRILYSSRIFRPLGKYHVFRKVLVTWLKPGNFNPNIYIFLFQKVKFSPLNKGKLTTSMCAIKNIVAFTAIQVFSEVPPPERNGNEVGGIFCQCSYCHECTISMHKPMKEEIAISLCKSTVAFLQQI